MAHTCLYVLTLGAALGLGVTTRENPPQSASVSADAGVGAVLADPLTPQMVAVPSAPVATLAADPVGAAAPAATVIAESAAAPATPQAATPISADVQVASVKAEVVAPVPVVTDAVVGVITPEGAPGVATASVTPASVAAPVALSAGSPPATPAADVAAAVPAAPAAPATEVAGPATAVVATDPLLAATGARAATPTVNASSPVAPVPVPPLVSTVASVDALEEHWQGAERVLKILGLVTNVLLQLSPVRVVREIQQAGSTLHYDPLPIFVLFLGSLNWVVYGLAGIATGDSEKVDLIQGFILGVVGGAFYVYTFFVNCQDSIKRESIASMIRAGAMLIFFEFFCVLLLTSETSTLILGGISALFSIIVSAAPLVSIEDVFRTQSAESMQPDMVIVSFCASCIWTALGFIMHDAFIALPNCFSVAIGSVQLHLILKFTGATISVKDLDGEMSSIHPEKTGTKFGSYEASLYKQAKIFCLLSMAHAHFVLVGYLQFAASTLTETYRWFEEARCQRWDISALLSFRGCLGKQGMEMSENHNLI